MSPSINIEEIVREVLDELQKVQHVAIQKEDEDIQDPAGKWNSVSTVSHEEEIFFSEEMELGVESPKSNQSIERAQQITPARIGIGRAGTRMKTRSYLKFRIDHAAAQDAVLKDVDVNLLHQLDLPMLETKAQDMRSYLMDLEQGRRLNEASIEWLRTYGEKGKQVQILVCDGLSSSAVEANIPDLLPAILQGLKLKNISAGKPLFIKRARVWVQDHAAALLDCDVVVSLIGERPGLTTAESMSAYMIYRPNSQTVEADRTVISNIHKGGISPVEAGAHIADVIGDILTYKKSGVKLIQAMHSNQ